MPTAGNADLPIVVLGAGYAGLRVSHELRRLGKAKVLLLDRHPFSVLRTELYKVADLARRTGGRNAWLVPLARSIHQGAIEFRTGEVESIDLVGRTVRFGGEALPFTELAIGLGSDVAYYGVPGAPEFTHQVYHYAKAIELAQALKTLESSSAGWAGNRRPRVLVVGGGSTGTEVAADIAGADWSRITHSSAKPPQVTVVCGELPFLLGFSDPIRQHAREILGRLGVELSEGVNVVRVTANELLLKDGSRLGFDLCVWAAGVQAPPVVRGLPVAHGHGGRVVVEPTLELPGHEGVFALGDSAELVDPRTGVIVPAMAQAALAEAPVAAANLVARREGRPLKSFVYRERGSIVALGPGRGAGEVRRIPLWGRPAGVLKAAVERGVSTGQRSGIRPPGL